MPIKEILWTKPLLLCVYMHPTLHTQLAGDHSCFTGITMKKKPAIHATASHSVGNHPNLQADRGRCQLLGLLLIVHVTHKRKGDCCACVQQVSKGSCNCCMQLVLCSDMVCLQQQSSTFQYHLNMQHANCSLIHHCKAQAGQSCGLIR